MTALIGYANTPEFQQAMLRAIRDPQDEFTPEELHEYFAGKAMEDHIRDTEYANRKQVIADEQSLREAGVVGRLGISKTRLGLRERALKEGGEQAKASMKTRVALHKADIVSREKIGALRSDYQRKQDKWGIPIASIGAGADIVYGFEERARKEKERDWWKSKTRSTWG